MKTIRKLYGAKINRDYGAIPLKVEAALRSIAHRDNREAKAKAKAQKAADYAEALAAQNAKAGAA